MEVGIPGPPEVYPGRASNSCWGTVRHGPCAISARAVTSPWWLPALWCWCPWTPGVDPSSGGTVLVRPECPWAAPPALEQGHTSRSCPLWQCVIYRWACADVTAGHTVSSMGTLVLRAGGPCCWQPWCSPVNHPVRAWWAMGSKWFIEPGSWVKLECCPVLLNRVT